MNFYDNFCFPFLKYGPSPASFLFLIFVIFSFQQQLQSQFRQLKLKKRVCLGFELGAAEWAYH